MEKTVLWKDFAHAFVALRRMHAMAALGQMPPGDFFLLESLHHTPGDMRVSALAQRMSVAPSAVSRMLRLLEEKNWVARTIDREDRRNTYVTLTPEGEKARKEAEKRMEEFFCELSAQVGEQEMRQWIHLSQCLCQGAGAVLAKLDCKKSRISTAEEGRKGVLDE